MKNLSYEWEPVAFEAKLPCVPDAAADSRGNIYAMTDGPVPILVFDAAGRLLRGMGEGIIEGCHGLYIDENDLLYCVDSGSHTVVKLTLQGEELMRLGNRGVPSDTGCVKGNFKTIRRGAGPFNVPSKVTVAPSGDIFVCDGYGNARIHRFSAGGKLLASFGEPGGKPGQLRVPHGIGVDAAGRVYVADRENDRVQVFDAEGRVLDIWEDIWRPDGLCVADNKVYVAELGHIFYVDNVLYRPYENMPWSRVRVFSTRGEELACFGGPDPEVPGNMWAAHSVSVDRKGCVYVGEAGWPENERPRPENLHPALQKFRPAG